MFRRAYQLFDPRQLPLMTRQSYRYEMGAAMLFPIAIMFSQHEVVRVLADKAFGASELAIATISAAPLFCMLTSLFWARLSRGLPKVRFINALQVGMAIGVGLIALLPPTRAGSWMLTGIVILCSILGVGIVTLRAHVWRMNYPRHVRGRATSRLSMVMTAVLIVSSLLAGALLKDHPQRYIWVYPLGAALALIGAWSYGRVRLRGQAEQLRYERQEAKPQRRGDPAATYEYDRSERSPGFWAVLKQDRVYRQYMTCQFIVGMANMMLGPVLVWMISHDWQCDFFISVLILTGIRHGLIMLTMPMWASFLDKSHVTHVRVRQGYFWSVGMALMGIGAYQHSLVLVTIGIAILSIAFGGGALAWNLGHNDFASRRMVSAYMGVHVTLAGVRGSIAPYLGMALYAGTPEINLGWLGLHLPAWAGIGYAVFFVAATLALIGSIGFFRLERRLARGRGEPTDG